MRLQVNGEVREVAEGLSLTDLIAALKLAPERIAVELNQSVVRRLDWPATRLEPDDRIEIVHFVGGGVKGQERDQNKLAADLRGKRGSELQTITRPKD
ncbi:MAG: sulfur carrier protein ThiS [Pyrinomonadaceae bacterium]